MCGVETQIHINQQQKHSQHIITMTTPVTATTVQSFQAKFYIDKRDVGMVIGGKGKTINGIKRTHGVDVRIMDSDRADGKQFFLITGSDRSKVDAAYKNIDQVAANSERKRLNPIPAPAVPGYGSPHSNSLTPPGYTVTYAGHNYIVPHGMVLVPAQMMPQPQTQAQPAMTPPSGYSSVPYTPQKPKGGRKVRRKKGPVPPPVLPAAAPSSTYNPTSPAYTPHSPDYLPRSTVPEPTWTHDGPKSPDYAPPSPDYMPHTPDGPPPKTPPAEDKTEGSGADAQ